MSCETSLLSLVRLGLGHHASIENKRINWEQIKALAIHQGVSAVVLDGIEKLPEAMRPQRAYCLSGLANLCIIMRKDIVYIAVLLLS